jgi:hypothetical protein
LKNPQHFPQMTSKQVHIIWRPVLSSKQIYE